MERTRSYLSPAVRPDGSSAPPELIGERCGSWPVNVEAHDGLVIVDVQNDFLPGGALAVGRGDQVVPVLNAYIRHFTGRNLPVFATRDWHPENHVSFHRQSGAWPPHCMADTPGAGFAPALNLPATAIVVSKGTDPAREAYSGFEGTELEAQLRRAGVRRLFVGGLATDYCVLQTVRDALSRGFEVYLLRDAIRAVNLEATDGERAEAAMREQGAWPLELAGLVSRPPGVSALLTDFYQLTMLQAYDASRMEETAVFEFFVRRLPAGWAFLVAAGLEQAIDYLEDFRLTAAEIDWLAATGRFGPEFLRQLGSLRFTGDVHAMPEGTIFFPHEPILRVTAPIAQAQIVETRLVNLLHFQTLIASKAVRSVLAAPGKTLVDFGLRRAHGAEAGLLAARACVLAGFAATSDVLAAQSFGLQASGTMAHSFIEACDSEAEAFRLFARANPDDVVLLLDTYNSVAAAETVVRMAPGLQAEGITVKGVRLDSGDLAAQAARVRRILDAGGQKAVTIVASGNLDEFELGRLVAAGAPIDAYGLGSRIVTAADAAYLDCAYKIQEYAGRPRCKLSAGKATWPGSKQVHRRFDQHGRMESDVIALADEVHRGIPLLQCVMRQGRRLGSSPLLVVAQHRLRQQIEMLPAALCDSAADGSYPVTMSGPLQELARRLGLTTDRGGTTGPYAHTAFHPTGFSGHIYADGSPAEADDEEAVAARRGK